MLYVNAGPAEVAVLVVEGFKGFVTTQDRALLLQPYATLFEVYVLFFQHEVARVSSSW